MGIWDRIKGVAKANSNQGPAKEERTVLKAEPGDILEASLESYKVVGATRNSHRNAALLSLENGASVKYLYVEEREKTEYVLYDFMDGRLDRPDEVPTTLDMDGVKYHLEEQYAGDVTVRGKTPFSSFGEQHVWQFQSDNRRFFRIEWQDGRFVFYEGERLLPSEVNLIQST